MIRDIKDILAHAEVGEDTPSFNGNLPTAGINLLERRSMHMHFNAIEVYGVTLIEAQELRNEVLRRILKP